MVTLPLPPTLVLAAPRVFVGPSPPLPMPDGVGVSEAVVLQMGLPPTSGGS